jgi:hypothetical protein
MKLDFAHRHWLYKSQETKRVLWLGEGARGREVSKGDGREGGERGSPETPEIEQQHST